MAPRFQNNLHFALRKEAPELREKLPLNQIEKIGNKFSWFAYGFKDFFVKIFADPGFLTICFTFFAMILNAFLFYPSETWHILSTIINWIVNVINWDYVRFCLWLLSEVTIFGIGLRAFGRFTNQQLMKYYQERDGIAS
jgi:hypothetical protein